MGTPSSRSGRRGHNVDVNSRQLSQQIIRDGTVEELPQPAMGWVTDNNVGYMICAGILNQLVRYFAA